MIINGMSMSLEQCMVSDTRRQRKKVAKPMSEYVWVAYSKNYPWLPIAIADTATELAKIVGTRTNTIHESLSRAKHGVRSVTYYARVYVGGNV